MGLFRRKKRKENTNFFSSQVSATMMNRAAGSTNEAVSGMEVLRAEGAKLLNNINEIKQGNLFEIIERTKFNMDAASKGMSERAVTTAEIGLRTDAADILIKDGDQVLREVQAKSSNKASSATFMISKEKYHGMQKLVNSDKVDKARELAESRAGSGTLNAAEYADTAENITGELNYGEIRSGGTMYDEALSAAEDYKNYARQFEIDQFKRELGQSVQNAAIVSSVVGGGISIVRNTIALSKGNIGKQELLGNIVADTGKSALRGGVTGGLGTTIRVSALKSGNMALAKTNIATSVAAGTIDVGVTVVSYIRGEIDAEQAMIQMGEKSFNTMSSVYGGMAAGAVFGPGGALVGSMVGYMLASNVYQTCVDTFKHAKLREEEAYRLIGLYEESLRLMKEEREIMKDYFAERVRRNDKQLERFIADFEGGVLSNDIGCSIQSMSSLATYLGGELKHLEFGTFDQAMKSDDSLIL